MSAEGARRVKISSVASDLPFAAFPGRYAAELLDIVRPMHPTVPLAESVLETALHNA